MPDSIAVIGGSGLYEMEGFQSRKLHRIATPFGKPSDPVIEGRLHRRTVFFLPRHGVGHRLLPSEINYRANIYALKKLGVRQVLSVSAVGSLQKQFEPGNFVLVDQFIDRTKGARKSSFFGEGCVGHISLAHPVCDLLAERVASAGAELSVTMHLGGTYVCMEGPAFSTRAESRINHEGGLSVIGMTNVPEAYLAREAGICYCTIAMVTDYDSWNEEEEAVTAERVAAVMKDNVARARQLISKVVAALPDPAEAKTKTEPAPGCPCRKASQSAIMTDPKKIPPKTKSNLKVVLA